VTVARVFSATVASAPTRSMKQARSLGLGLSRTSVTFDGLKTDRWDKVKGVYASGPVEMLTTYETDSRLSPWTMIKNPRRCAVVRAVIFGQLPKAAALIGRAVTRGRTYHAPLSWCALDRDTPLAAPRAATDKTSTPPGKQH